MSLMNTFIGARSHFSIGESMLTPKSIVTKAVAQGAKAVALTDTMTISSMVDFTSAAKKADIKPIIGCRVRVVEDPTYRKPKKGSGEEEKPNPEFFLNLFVKNDQGMTNLIKLLSQANSEEYFYYYPRVGLADVIDALYGDNLIVSTSDFYSVFHRADYLSVLEKIKSAHNEAQTFIEIVPIDTPLFDRLNAKALEASHVLGIDLIASYPSLYEENEDALTLEVLAAVNTNTQMDAPWRSQQYVKDFSICGTSARVKKLSAMKERLTKFHPEVRAEWVDNLGSAVKNLVKFAELCEYEWKKQPVSLPVMAANEYETLVSIVKQGWSSRLTKPTLGYQPDKSIMPKYVERLKYELGVLRSMGFERYFLMVSDLVNWSKNSNIMVGPGRGSAGGSLVAYLMGIVDTDPIRFGLFFERFINPDRLDLPDVDLDFMSSRRHEVIDYLIDKYGQDRVAGISNYGTMASASALRDSGRVFGLGADKLTCTRYVPKEHGSSVTLDEAAAAVPEIMAFRSEHPELWNHATKLEGKMRSLGKHAAGVVVAGEPITNRAVVENRSGTQVVNWDKRTVEDWGLIKMDILGLSTLDTLTKTVELIQKRHSWVINLTMLPLDDEKTIQAFGNGQTIGIFQFESGGMRKLLKDLASSGNLTFADIVATTALYRPGPMDAGLMDDYVAIKTGKKSPWYDHESMKDALEETYGVMVYQEQIMQVVRDLAGFTMTEADHVRKAIGKKDMAKMMEMKDQFVSGAEMGFIDIELEDGSTKRFHRNHKFNCPDGIKRTAEEAFELGVDINT